MTAETRSWREVGFSQPGGVLIRMPAEVACEASEIALASAPLETGGLLLGRYTAGRSVLTVTAALPPPPDSLHGRTDFVRGTVGLTETIETAQLADPSVHVVGEWHTHPGGDPAPSGTDHRGMRRFAWRGLFGCRSPVLLVLGGRPEANALWSATMYRRWRGPLGVERAW